MKRSQWKAGLTGMCLAVGALVMMPRASAQNAPIDVELEPPPQPVALLLTEKPTVTLVARGDHGPVRVTGTLEGPAGARLRLTDPSGVTREAAWTEIRAANLAEFAAEGIPAGSYRVQLVTDAPMSGQAAGSSLSRIYDSTQGTWRALELPVGQLTLRGQPYGTLAFPTARLTAFLLEPLRGNLGELPAGNIRLEVLGGAVVNIPLTQVQLYQRDVARGTLRVTLMDEQMFSGKVLELPKVSLSVDTGREKQSIPLDRVAQMERTPPGGRRF